MKYSNYIGVITAIALIASCFIPWVYIESIHTTFTGFNTGQTNFGRPGVMHVFLCIFSIIFFFLPKVWAKRANLFVVTFNLAWALRNFLLVTQCQMGECPQKKLGMYAIIILSLLLLLMSLFPKLDIKD